MGYRVVADENIQVTSALKSISDSLTLLPGREISRADLCHADVLLVRSVTPVRGELLEGTPVRFVGTATAGVEHIDQDALEALGICFACAPGSNAITVAEYVLAVLAELEILPRIFAGACCGIIGYGYVGRAVTERLQALGGDVRVWDPLASVPKELSASSLEEAMRASVVSLHANLHDNQRWPSAGMINRDIATQAPEGQVFINAGRGGLVTTEALDIFAKQGITLALDTWPDEPNITRDLLSKVKIATPHIAGYSLDAKTRATDQLIAALCGSGGITTMTSLGQHVENVLAEEVPFNHFRAKSRYLISEATDWLITLLLNRYKISAVDQALRAHANPDVGNSDFDMLRRSYPLHRELAGQMLTIPSGKDYQSIAAAIGIKDQSSFSH